MELPPENTENSSSQPPQSNKKRQPSRLIKDLRKEIKRKRKKLVRDKDATSKRAKTLEIAEKAVDLLEGNTTLVTSSELKEVLDKASPNVAQEIKAKAKIWEATELQLKFLASDEDEVLFSGGRGSGKSDALLIDPLRYCGNKNFRGLIIRRTMPELRELISRAQDYYSKTYPGVKWKEQEKLFKFPSGAIIEFGYCDSVDDLMRYQGQQYTWLGIDEVTQYSSDEILNKLKASLRSTDPTLKIYIRATCNPGGAGRNWVKARWVDLGSPDTLIEADIKDRTGKSLGKITRRWFHSTVEDNKHLIENNPHYLISLESLDGVLKQQWRYGDWDSADGLAFADFKKAVHVVEPYAVSNNWLKFRAADWGRHALAVCLWMAVDNEGTLIVYRELTANGTKCPDDQRIDADTFAQQILAAETQDRIAYGVLDSSCWARKGEIGPSIAETMIKLGCRWRPSDRSPGSRIAGRMQMHQLLRINTATNKPKIVIFNNCVELIKELSSLTVDENNPEDVDQSGDDHAWDACRYGIMSRPYRGNPLDPLNRPEPQPKLIISDKFGY